MESVAVGYQTGLARRSSPKFDDEARFAEARPPPTANKLSTPRRHEPVENGQVRVPTFFRAREPDPQFDTAGVRLRPGSEKWSSVLRGGRSAARSAAPTTHRKAARATRRPRSRPSSIATASRRDTFAVTRGYVVGTGSFVAKRNNVTRFHKRHARGPVIAKVVDMLENKVINSHLRTGVPGVTAGGGGMRAGDGRTNFEQNGNTGIGARRPDRQRT